MYRLLILLTALTCYPVAAYDLDTAVRRQLKVFAYCLKHGKASIESLDASFASDIDMLREKHAPSTLQSTAFIDPYVPESTPKIVTALLEAGFNPQLSNKPLLRLYLAYPAVVRLLLAHNVDPVGDGSLANNLFVVALKQQHMRSAQEIYTHLKDRHDTRTKQALVNAAPFLQRCYSESLDGLSPYYQHQYLLAQLLENMDQTVKTPSRNERCYQYMRHISSGNCPIQ